mgnify:FL=1
MGQANDNCIRECLHVHARHIIHEQRCMLWQQQQQLGAGVSHKPGTRWSGRPVAPAVTPLCQAVCPCVLSVMRTGSLLGVPNVSAAYSELHTHRRLHLTYTRAADA